MSESGQSVESSELNKASLIDEKTEQKPLKKDFVDKTADFLLSRKEILAGTLIAGGELYREILTRDPILTPEHLLDSQIIPEAHSILFHGGGVFDAYLGSMLTYYGLSLITHPFKDKVHKNIKVAVASLVGMSAVVANEMGVLGGTGELADIPAGVIGSMIFSGVMLLNRKFIKDVGLKIQKLTKQIEKENRQEQQTHA